MPKDNYITASCVISKLAVYKDNTLIFKNELTNLPGFLLSVYRHLNMQYPKFYKMDGPSKLGLLAAEVLLSPGFRSENYAPEEVGIVLANANSSLDTDLKYFQTVKEMASPALFVYTLPNIMVGEICIRHQFKGENAFFVSDRFDGAFMKEYVNNLLNNNILQACICGWVELLENNYKAVLFLVERNANGKPVAFTNENIYKIYESDNGEINE